MSFTDWTCDSRTRGFSILGGAKLEGRGAEFASQLLRWQWPSSTHKHLTSFGKITPHHTSALLSALAGSKISYSFSLKPYMVLPQPTYVNFFLLETLLEEIAYIPTMVYALIIVHVGASPHSGIVVFLWPHLNWEKSSVQNKGYHICAKFQEGYQDLFHLQKVFQCTFCFHIIYFMYTFLFL